jgi:hypothetical protein
VTLHRLTRQQVAAMIGRIAHGKVLPTEVVEQIVAKTRPMGCRCLWRS